MIDKAEYYHTKYDEKLVNAAAHYLYCNIILKTLVTLLCIYFVFFGYFILKSDVNKKYDAAIDRQMKQILECEQKYNESNCDFETHDAFIEICDEWKECMQRKPIGESKSKLYAEFLGEITEKFFRSISLKALITIVFIALIIHFSMKIQ